MAKKDIEKSFLSETFIYEKDEFKDIDLTFSNNSIAIYPSEDDKIKIVVVYDDYEVLLVNNSEDELNIAITSNWYNKFINGFKLYDLTGYMFDKTIEVYLPNLPYNLNIKTSNGSIKSKDVTLKDVSLKTSNGVLDISHSIFNTIELYTSNGAIIIDQVSSKKADLETSNGGLIIKDISIKELFGNTSNGKITGFRIKGDLINLTTSNGAITLDILGSFDDYRVTTKTSNGKVKINDITYGSDTYHTDQQLIILTKTSNGNIYINFSDD